MDVVEQFKKDVAEDGCGDVGSLLDEIERLRAELAKQQSLTEAALQVAESAQRRADRDLAASQAREKVLRDGWRAMDEAARDIRRQHLENKEGDLYHAMQWLSVTHGPMLKEIPTDDTALRAALAQREQETIERCVKAFSQWDREGRWAASVIRALEVKP